MSSILIEAAEITMEYLIYQKKKKDKVAAKSLDMKADEDCKINRQSSKLAA